MSPLDYWIGRYRRCWRRNRAGTKCTIVVASHSTRCADCNDQRLFGIERGIAVNHFEPHLSFLTRSCNSVVLSILVRGSRTGFAFFLAVRFDDGYEDKLTVAARVLKQFDVPAMLA